jgi:dihydrofolate reductase
MIISLIAAMSENRVIGSDNRLPWHLPEDLKRFRALTRGHPVIMGRKTWDSIGGKPLPQRDNIVLTRQPGFAAPGARVFSSLNAALEDLRNSLPADAEVFVIGGAEIYRLALPIADRIYLTVVHRTVAGDAFFPEVPAARFKEAARDCRGEFSFVDYVAERS